MATPTTTKTEVKEDILDLAERIAGAVTIDKESGIGSEEGSTYEANLPEGLDMDTIKRVSDYNTTFIAAGAHAVGTLAIKAMAEASSLQQVSADLKMGVRDNVSYGVDRSRTYTNSLGGEKTETVKHGVVTVAYEVNAGKNAGQLKKVRNAISELAMAELTK